MKTKRNGGGIATALLRLAMVATLVAAIGFSFTACPVETSDDGGGGGNSSLISINATYMQRSTVVTPNTPLKT